MLSSLPAHQRCGYSTQSHRLHYKSVLAFASSLTYHGSSYRTACAWLEPSLKSFLNPPIGPRLSGDDWWIRLSDASHQMTAPNHSRSTDKRVRDWWCLLPATARRRAMFCQNNFWWKINFEIHKQLFRYATSHVILTVIAVRASCTC